MTHFGPEYVDYFRRLKRNNRREWFHANKQVYEEHVREPFREFVGEIIKRIGAIEGDLGLEPKDAIFRIARDARFSKDKTPYKTHMAAAIVRGGGKNAGLPGFYFQFGAEGLAFAGGLHTPDAAAVAKVRRAMLNDGATFAKLLRAKAFKDLYGALAGEQNKRLAPEFAAVADKWPFIAHKQFYCWAGYDDPQQVLSPDLVQLTLRHYRAGAGISAFLRDALR